MGREYRVQQALAPVYPAVPRMVGLCEDPAVLGVPFYVMERIEGLVPRWPLPDGLVLAPSDARRLCEALVEKLVELHRVDVAAAGLGALSRGPGYVRRQVAGWSERYVKARTWNVPSFARVRRWLAERAPDDAGACVIHNDYRFDNVVLDPGEPTRIVGVLDWEMATVGDPLMDLGTTLGYWIDPDDPEEVRALPFGPTALPGNLSRRELVERYAQASGRRTGDMLFHYVFALFKIAVIAQQIYRRFRDGHTTDPRFAMLVLGVNILGAQAERAIDRGRLEALC
jgi:aminoglycoside phosphotransferase (APT) family kinase protein